MARPLLVGAPPIRSVRPTVRHALEQAVLTALAKVPADRFATAGQFARALNAPDEVTLDGEGGESIAVLPFANLSGDPDFEYFSGASPKRSSTPSRSCPACAWPRGRRRSRSAGRASI